MLVLGRKLGERLVVPELGLSITVLQIKGKQVRLGIEAPPDITVLREELCYRRKALCDEKSASPAAVAVQNV